jgi:hypothetical protein
VNDFTLNNQVEPPSYGYWNVHRRERNLRIEEPGCSSLAAALAGFANVHAKQLTAAQMQHWPAEKILPLNLAANR